MNRSRRILGSLLALFAVGLSPTLVNGQGNQSCTYIPPCGAFSATQDWVSQANTGNYPALVAGDIDGDGIPEVVANRPNSNQFFVINGTNGTTKLNFTSPAVPGDGAGIAIGDVDYDGFGEILVPAGGRVYCFEHTGVLKYTSAPLAGTGRTVVNLADFNQDGIPEAYVGNYIINAQTGALLASAGFGNSKGRNPSRNDFEQPVAVDALPDGFCAACDGLELVAGNVVWAVDLVAGTMTAAVTAPAGYSDGYTSVADYDRDGDVDALVQGQRNGQNVVYGWDLQTSTVLGFYAHGIAVAGRINIGDLDGDGQMEASFAGRNLIVAIETNFTLKWSGVTQDVSSGITGTSVFDFCGDGTYEVVYRDEQFLRVYNGANGAVIFSTGCTSATHIENPLIMDVDGDGQTEIVTSCGTVTIAYESATTPWIPSRDVWNQHPYFNVNVNDDLTIPALQLPHWTLGNGIEFNTFMNQRPPVDSAYQVTFLAPDVYITAASSICVGNQLQVSMTVCNQGDNNFPSGQTYSFYDANPTTGPANLLGVRLGATTILPGQCATEVFSIPLFLGTIYAVANDDGSTPRPFSFASFPNTNTGECDFTNNMRSFQGGPCCTPPTITCPAGITVNNTTGLCGSSVTYTATATGTTPTITYSSVPGSFFPVGNTIVTATATNGCGVASCTFTVTVLDNELPVLSCPANINVNSTPGQCGAAVSFSASAQDNCPGVTTMQTAGLGSGSVFPVGVSNIAFTATDASGNTASCAFSVTVVDNEAPVIACPSNQSVNTDQGQCGAVVNYTVSATDNCAATLSQTAGSTSGSTFTLGTSTVSYSAIDASGNTATCSFTVTVTDNEAPSVICLDHTVNISSGGSASYTTAQLDGGSNDNCGIATVSGGPLNYTCADLGVNPYTLTVTDVNGNSSSANCTITVTNDPIAVSLSAITYNCGYNVSCHGASDGAVSSSVSGGCAPYSYVWNGTSGTANVAGASAGNYILVVTDANGNSASASIALTQPDALTIAMSGSNALCNGNANGSSCAAVTGGCAPYSYAWSNGGTGNCNTGLIAGTYSVSVTDANGCTINGSYTVNQPAVLTVTAGANVSVYYGYGSNCATLTQTTTGGTPAYSGVWTDGNNTVVGTNVCPSVTTTYCYTVTDANGCTATACMKVCVLDIRCTGTSNNGNNGGNSGGQGGQGWMNGNAPQHIVICHTPPGQPGTSWIQCLPPSAVPAHLAHGDYLGACGVGGPNFICNSGNTKQDENAVTAQGGLVMRAFPNPSTGLVNVELSSETGQSGIIEIKVMDALGKVVDRKQVTLAAGHAISEFNLSNQSTGFYFIMASDGKSSLTEKVMKN